MAVSTHCPCIPAKGSRTSVIHLVVTRVNRALEQLIHFLLAHLLAQVGQNVLDLALANEPRAILVKDLESADVLFDIERLAEAAGPVEDLGEGLKVDCGLVSVDREEWTRQGPVGKGVRDLQSFPTPRSRSAISVRVGFWPHARSRSPKAPRSTRPLPRLSKSWKASR